MLLEQKTGCPLTTQVEQGDVGIVSAPTSVVGMSGQSIGFTHGAPRAVLRVSYGCHKIHSDGVVRKDCGNRRVIPTL